MKIRAALLALSLGALLASSVVAVACAVTDVDLGSDHRAVARGTGEQVPEAGPVTTSDCPALTEAEAEDIYGTPCGGSCFEGLGPARELSSSADLEAVISGRWQTCSGHVPWPDDVVGVQFQAGCTVFLLHEAPGDAGVVEGVTPDDQGTFNVLQTTDGTKVTRSLELFFPSWTWTVSVVTSDCPHGMTFTQADGGATFFSAFTTKTPPLQ